MYILLFTVFWSFGFILSWHRWGPKLIKYYKNVMPITPPPDMVENARWFFFIFTIFFWPVIWMWIGLLSLFMRFRRLLPFLIFVPILAHGQDNLQHTDVVTPGIALVAEVVTVPGYKPQDTILKNENPFNTMLLNRKFTILYTRDSTLDRDTLMPVLIPCEKIEQHYPETIKTVIDELGQPQRIWIPPSTRILYRRRPNGPMIDPDSIITFKPLPNYGN